ncbi:exosortase/archaeosortase family protein [Thiomicrorhabdus hydrogeniphila]
MLFFIESFSPFYIIQTLQTDLTIYLTQLWINSFDIPVKMIGNTVYLEHGFKIWILDPCNGLIAFLLFAVAIVAYPTAWLSRLKWLVEGYVYLVVVNSIRIDFVIYVTMFDATYFHCAHDHIGMLAMGTMTLAIFILFTLRVQTFKYLRRFYQRRKQKHDRRHSSFAHEWREPSEEHRHLVDRRQKSDRRKLVKNNPSKTDEKK